jgi:hypothetical protein
MTPIDTEAKARALAAAVLTDLRLHFAEIIASDGDLAPVLAEGRALFRSRVVPELHPLFDTVLLEAALRGK